MWGEKNKSMGDDSRLLQSGINLYHKCLSAHTSDCTCLIRKVFVIIKLGLFVRSLKQNVKHLTLSGNVHMCNCTHRSKLYLEIKAYLLNDVTRLMISEKK